MSDVSGRWTVWTVRELYRLKSYVVGKWRSTATARLLRRLCLIRFDTDPVVDGATQLLLASLVMLGCLGREMTEQKLDLIQFAAG